MCARHHKIIDTHPEEYSVEKLKSLKKTHESRYYSQQLEATGLMLHQLQMDSEKYWSSLKSLDKKDDTGFKMELGDNDLYSLMKDIEELYVGLNNSIDSITESSLRLQDDIKIECEKCGIDYSLFDKIPYYENSLVNRDWETVSLSFPNHLAKLKTRYYQLCVNLLEKIVISNPDLLDLLDKCKKELRSSHESAYYMD